MHRANGREPSLLRRFAHDCGSQAVTTGVEGRTCYEHVGLEPLDGFFESGNRLFLVLGYVVVPADQCRDYGAPALEHLFEGPGGPNRTLTCLHGNVGLFLTSDAAEELV